MYYSELVGYMSEDNTLAGNLQQAITKEANSISQVGVQLDAMQGSSNDTSTKAENLISALVDFEKLTEQFKV